MDHSEQQHAQKKEPTLAGAVLARPVIEAGEMPAWLNQPAAAPTAGQRWGRRFIFLGVSLLTIAVAGGATLLALDLVESNSSMAVVAANSAADVAARATSPAATGALPFDEKRTVSLPPLVMLPQDPNAAHKKEAVASAAPVAAAPPEVVAQPATPAPPPPAPPAVKKVEKPAPAVAAAAPKPVKSAAQPPRKTALAPKPTPAMVAKKAALQAKRIATPTVAKVQPRIKPVKGTMLQPPRARGLDPAFQDPPRQAIDRRCRPGELARECEARTR